MCWECGAIINLELVSDDKVEAEELIANMEQAQKEQDKRQRIEEKQEQEAGAEYGVISAIHTFFSIISILAVIGGILRVSPVKVFGLLFWLFCQSVLPIALSDYSLLSPICCVI